MNVEQMYVSPGWNANAAQTHIPDRSSGPVSTDHANLMWHTPLPQYRPPPRQRPLFERIPSPRHMSSPPHMPSFQHMSSPPRMQSPHHTQSSQHLPLPQHVPLFEHMPLPQHVPLFEHMPLPHTPLPRHMPSPHYLPLPQHMPFFEHMSSPQQLPSKVPFAQHMPLSYPPLGYPFVYPFPYPPVPWNMAHLVNNKSNDGIHSPPNFVPQCSLDGHEPATPPSSSPPRPPPQPLGVQTLPKIHIGTPSPPHELNKSKWKAKSERRRRPPVYHDRRGGRRLHEPRAAHSRPLWQPNSSDATQMHVLPVVTEGECTISPVIHQQEAVEEDPQEKLEYPQTNMNDGEYENAEDALYVYPTENIASMLDLVTLDTPSHKFTNWGAVFKPRHPRHPRATKDDRQTAK